jgi:hypothetical protein
MPTHHKGAKNHERRERRADDRRAHVIGLRKSTVLHGATNHPQLFRKKRPL